MAVGCSFCAVYIPGYSSAVHICGHDSAGFGFHSQDTGLPCFSETLLSLPDDYDCKIHQVACGREHIIVLTTDGRGEYTSHVCVNMFRRRYEGM